MVLLGDIMSTSGDIVRTSEATTIHVVGYDEHILRCSVYWEDVLSSPGDVLKISPCCTEHTLHRMNLYMTFLMCLLSEQA